MAAARAALSVLVLAAGKGTRFRSKTIKLLHSVAGGPMIGHVIETARALGPSRLVTVVGYQGDRVREALSDAGCEFVVQKEQRGTGHAVLQAARKLSDRTSTLLILNGDLPTLRPATLRRVVARHRREGAALSVVTAVVPDPTGYGRVVRDREGKVRRIVEHGDASAAERRIREINCGIYCARPEELFRVLRRVRPDNAQGEVYLTDALQELLERGGKVVAIRHDDAAEVLGVNTRQELAEASRTLYRRKAQELQRRGVTLLDAGRTWIDPRARIGRDTVVYPGVIVEGASIIGEDCVLRPGCRIVATKIGRDVEVRDHSVITDSVVGNGVAVGPFAHVRPGSVLETGSRVGNFVELKKTRLARGSKANHLTYLGDATVGPDCNVGAGTITCNYDGERKHATRLGRGVFIGSNTQLIAPVNVGDRSYVAAGSTITEDVPAGSLAIARSRQRNIKGWVARNERRRKATASRKKKP